MTIRVLPDTVAAKIAAGEIVERPVSVVKELIENSIDAKASTISVELKGGGIELIRVSDNGEGINPDEITLVFERHATSKVINEDDLDSIATLGFRGEAMPSISTVSRMHVVSRRASREYGWTMKLNWGEITHSEPIGYSQGTSVSVFDLFENVPARRKFVKSPAAENERVKTLISKYVLAYPEITFELYVQDKEILKSPGTNNIDEAIASIYGTKLSDQMLPLSWEDPSGMCHVSGRISPPSLSKTNRNHITFFVNRRWVSSRTLSVALDDSYHGLLQQGRRAICIVNITVPFHDVDVNVHPTKREIKFSNESHIFSAVQRSVRGALINSSPIPQVQLNPNTGRTDVQAHSTNENPIKFNYLLEARERQALIKQPGSLLSNLRILGQINQTFIVTEGDSGLFILDQHAAHECVLFEKLCLAKIEQTPLVQTLIEPVTLEMKPSHIEFLENNLGQLNDYGFLLEHFGGSTYLLRGVPSIFKGSDPGIYLAEIIDMTIGETNSRNPEQVFAASIACHSAVRAGMTLTLAEMTETLNLLSNISNPHTCPHGRPTMMHLTYYQLERQFGRK